MSSMVGVTCMYRELYSYEKSFCNHPLCSGCQEFILDQSAFSNVALCAITYTNFNLCNIKLKRFLSVIA